jgi:hypothetical protein
MRESEGVPAVAGHGKTRENDWPQLTPCVRCGEEVSPNAKACPRCGEPDPSHVSKRPKRPALISVICVFVFLCAPLLLAGFAIPSVHEQVVQLYGPVYAGWFLLSMVFGLIPFVGYWRMRKWGVWLYAAWQAVNTILALAGAFPIPINALWAVGHVVPLFVLGVGFWNLRKMT